MGKKKIGTRSSSAIRTARSKDKYKSAGLREIKVWIEPSEADAVRKYAAGKPKTKAIRKTL